MELWWCGSVMVLHISSTMTDSHHGQNWQKSQMHILLQKRSTRKRSAQAEAACPWKYDCWILLLDYSQLILTHPTLVFPLIFQCLSKMGLFHFASCFPQTEACYSSKQIGNPPIIFYRIRCSIWSFLHSRRDPLAEIRLDTTWGLIQRHAIKCLLNKAQVKDMS